MRLKWVLAGVAGLLIVAFIVVYAVLMSYDFNQFKPTIIEEVKKATGRNLTLGGDINLKVSLSPSLVVEQVALSNAKWGTEPQMISAKRVEVRVELIPLLSSEVKLDKLVLIEPKVLIEINKDGKSNLEFTPAARKAAPGQAKGRQEQPAPSKAPTAKKEELSLPPLAFREMIIENGLVTYHDLKSGEKHTLALQSLKGSLPGMDQPVKLEVKGAVDEQAFSVAGMVGALDRLTGGGSPWPVEVKLGFREATLNVKGTIKNPLQGTGLDFAINAKGDDLAKLMPNTGLGGPFSLECKVKDPKPKVYKVSGLKLTAQGTDLTGWLQADVSAKRPAVVAEIKAGVLDLIKLPGMGAGGGSQAQAGKAEAGDSQKGQTAKPKEKAKPQPTKRRDKVFPADPLPLEALKSADADIKITAQKVVHNKLALENLDLQLKLSNGKLSIKPLTGKLAGGDLNLSLSLAPQGKYARTEMELSLVGSRTGELLEGLGQEKVVEAPLEVKAGFAGEGNSVAGIMAGLNGKLVAILEKGKIDNKYVDVAGGELGTVLGNIVFPTAKSKPYTSLNCMVMGFIVAGGKAKSNVILLNTENMVVLGDGKVNLGTEELDLVMHPSPKKGLTKEATGGMASLSLGELSKPFKLTGTLANPRVGIDEVGAITTLAKTVGGYALLGPLGAAAGALTSAGAGEEAGCAEAQKAARTGGTFKPKPAKEQSTSTSGKTDGQKSTGKGLEKDVEEGVNSLKKLFGN